MKSHSIGLTPRGEGRVFYLDRTKSEICPPRLAFISDHKLSNVAGIDATNAVVYILFHMLTKIRLNLSFPCVYGLTETEVTSHAQLKN